jgi:IS5 family transposase
LRLGFAGVDLVDVAPPDETTVCKFRHLLERHQPKRQSAAFG